MSNFYKTDELIESVKQRAFIPENQSTFTTEKFLRFANEEMMIGIVPVVMTLHEEHFIYAEDIPLVSDINRYAIPYRAMGSKLYEVAFKDTNGNLGEMSRITRDELPDYSTNFAMSAARIFFIENDEVVLVPNTSTNGVGFLQMSYYMRPNKLVDVSRAGQITSIDRNTGIITLDQVPNNFNTSILFDYIKYKSPHVVLDYDLTAASINSSLKTITFATGDIPARLAVGDYIMQSEETIIPTIPSDLHSVLAQRVACRCLEAMGDTQGLTNAMSKLKEMEGALDIIIDNRVESAPRKVVNRWGFLRSNRSRGIRR